MGRVVQYTYDSAVKADEDRAQQKSLLAVLGAWERALRRDECGAWWINSNNGSIHTWGEGKTWAVFVVPLMPALDLDQEEALLLHCDSRRGQRGLPAVAPAAHARAGKRHSRCSRHPQAARNLRGDARAAKGLCLWAEAAQRGER